MICSKCGFDAGQNKFCTNCGAEVVAQAAPQQPDYGTSQNTYNQNPAYGAAPQNGYNPNPGYGAAPQNGYNPNPAYGAAPQNGYNPNPAYGAAPQNGYNPNPAYGAAPYTPAEDVNLITAYKSFWKKYADFSGRSRRKEYWLAVVAHYIVTMILAMIYYIPFMSYVMDISNAMYTSSNSLPDLPAICIIGIVLLSIYSLATLVPSLALVVRRLHDIGKSGWYYFLGLIPCGIGAIILLVFMCQDSQPGVNQYGPNPKGY